MPPPPFPNAARPDAPPPNALRQVLVAGGGITAWCAAAALKRRAPFLSVTLLETPPAHDALADRIACTLPSIAGFHGDLGLRDEDSILRTGSGYRLGTLFAGWSADGREYVHAYDGYGHAIGTAAFPLHWLRAEANGGVAPFDAFAPAAALARAGRFVPPSPDTAFSAHEFGLTLDLPRYTRMLRAFAQHVGVAIVRDAIAGVEPDARGGIAAVALASGRRLAADLFIDATGPAAQLRATLDTARDDWSAWLPCDRVLLAHGPDIEPPVLTPVTAFGAGWHWASGAQSGLAYASAHLDDAAAAALLTGADAESIVVRPGTRREPWRGNCIAIGDAATQIDPLEWCNLHLALSAIDRLVAMLPDRDMAPVEAADFNRQTLAEAERVRDFLALHYRTTGRREPIWRAVAAAEPPASLAHTLRQFGERGRLPFYEEETFARDGWAAVLIGQGVRPRRIDPLVEGTPAAEAAAAMRAMTEAIAAALPHTPTHAAWIAAQARRLAR